MPAPGPGDFHTWKEMAEQAEQGAKDAFKDYKKALKKGDKSKADEALGRYRRRSGQAKHFWRKRKP